jgi:hypothetical protein
VTPAGPPLSGDEPPGTRRLFANRDLVRLFAAQAASLVGSGVTSVALAAPLVGLLAEHTEPGERG